jgi:hypothetical protein
MSMMMMANPIINHIYPIHPSPHISFFSSRTVTPSCASAEARNQTMQSQGDSLAVVRGLSDRVVMCRCLFPSNYSFFIPYINTAVKGLSCTNLANVLGHHLVSITMHPVFPEMLVISSYIFMIISCCCWRIPNIYI